MQFASFRTKLLIIALYAAGCGASADNSSHDTPIAAEGASEPDESDPARCETDEDCTECYTSWDPDEVGCYFPCCGDAPTTVAVCEANYAKLDQLCGINEICAVGCSTRRLRCIFGVCIRDLDP